MLQLDKVAGDSTSALGAILFLVALCGFADGVCQGALFGEAARLPPRYTQALVGGTAISGVALLGAESSHQSGSAQ